jgi:hypothetical protein
MELPKMLCLKVLPPIQKKKKVSAFCELDSTARQT